MSFSLLPGGLEDAVVSVIIVFPPDRLARSIVLVRYRYGAHVRQGVHIFSQS